MSSSIFSKYFALFSLDIPMVAEGGFGSNELESPKLYLKVFNQNLRAGGEGEQAGSGEW